MANLILPIEANLQMNIAVGLNACRAIRINRRRMRFDNVVKWTSFCDDLSRLRRTGAHCEGNCGPKRGEQGKCLHKTRRDNDLLPLFVNGFLPERYVVARRKTCPRKANLHCGRARFRLLSRQITMKMFGLNRIFAVVFILLLSPGAWAIDHSAEAAQHWAFQPLKAPQVPNAKGKSDIDRFVSAKLKEQTLGLSPEADRSSLIRRVAFTVTGLPPTPDEIEQFLADRKSGAYERMVERYLASPRYGEHWGKIWLDAAKRG